MSIIKRYEQWRANPSSIQPRAPASSTPSSLLTCAPLPYEQSSTDDDRARRERLRRLNVLLREDPGHREDVYLADSARENHTHLRDRREQEVRLWVAGQRQLEQDGILPRQREADYAAQAAVFGQPTGQNQGVTGPVMPVSSLTEAFQPHPDQPIYTVRIPGIFEMMKFESGMMNL